MAELLIRGSGRPPQRRDEALAAQAAWVAHRRRKVAAQVVLANQIQGQLDLIFPGLTGCFAHGLEAASSRVLIRDLPDPDRVRRPGVEGVLRFVRRRGVHMTRPKAEQVVRAAQSPADSREFSKRSMHVSWAAVSPASAPQPRKEPAQAGSAAATAARRARSSA